MGCSIFDFVDRCRGILERIKVSILRRTIESRKASSLLGVNHKGDARLHFENIVVTIVDSVL